MRVTSHEPSIGAGKLTYEDLLSISDESKRYEILDGELAVTLSPATQHQIVSANLEFLLHQHVREHGLGRVLHAPMDVILDAHTVVEPDILFVAASRAKIIEAHAIVGPPDLVVEILSPTTAARDKGVKAKLYARFGVVHYWLIDPVERTVETFRLSGEATEAAVYAAPECYKGDDVLRPSLFPGLEIELARLRE